MKFYGPQLPKTAKCGCQTIRLGRKIVRVAGKECATHKRA
jgi:hypothetical protein